MIHFGNSMRQFTYTISILVFQSFCARDCSGYIRSSHSQLHQLHDNKLTAEKFVTDIRSKSADGRIAGNALLEAYSGTAAAIRKACTVSLPILCSVALLALSPHNAANALPQAPPESNAQAILIDALPLTSEVRPMVKSVSNPLSKMTTEGSGNIRSVDSKGSKGIKGWTEVQRLQKAAEGALNSPNVGLKSPAFTSKLPAAASQESSELVKKIEKDLDAIAKGAANQDRILVVDSQIDALQALDRLASLAVSPPKPGQAPLNAAILPSASTPLPPLVANFPYVVPPNVAPTVPRLLGRATVEIILERSGSGPGGQARTPVKMIAEVDGYTAPITGGNFVDLVLRGAYDTDRAKVTLVDDSSVIVNDINAYVAPQADDNGGADGDFTPATRAARVKAANKAAAEARAAAIAREKAGASYDPLASVRTRTGEVMPLELRELTPELLAVVPKGQNVPNVNVGAGLKPGQPVGPPQYGETFDEMGKYQAKPILPFSAYGTMAMNHVTGLEESDLDLGSGEIGTLRTASAPFELFFLKFDPSYTPAGLNTLDGNYCVFGYVLKGGYDLDTVGVNDRVVSMKVVEGAENLVYPPSSSAAKGQ